MDELDTARLRLRPHAAEDLLALIAGRGEFERRTGLAAAEGLREFLTGGEVSPAWLAQLRAAAGVDPWRFGFGLIERETGEVVGTASFKGPPDGRGVVEIAYGIVPARQGRGYATEAAAALVRFAAADDRVSKVRAHTLPEANASTGVLTKCGFALVGEVTDPEDGRVWRWERPAASGE
jgi:RimJ/RimL family protein N-acetyltransferase